MKLSFDWGGFLGSIVGIFGAYGVAKWQFKKQSNAERELNKELFIRQHRVVELKNATYLYDKVDDLLIKIQVNELKKPFNRSYYEELINAIKEVMNYSIDINCYEYLLEHFDDVDKLFLERFNVEMEKELDNAYSKLINTSFKYGIEDFKEIRSALIEYRKIINKRKIIIHDFMIFNNMCFSKLTTTETLNKFIEEKRTRYIKTFKEIDDKFK